MMLRSLAPINENCSVRGIGVAVKVKQSTVAFKVFSFSLCATPNFCSSSIIIKPRSLNFTVFANKPCVPMMISTFPSSTFLSVSFFLWKI
jgi:hypothetical protein